MTKKSTPLSIYYRKKELRRKKTLQFLAAIAVITGIITSLPDLYDKNYTVTLLRFFALLPFALVFVWNAYNRVNLAANFFQFYSGFLIFLFSGLVGQDSFIQLYFIPLVMGVPYFFDSSNKKTFFSHLLLPTLYMAILYLTDFQLFSFEFPTLQPELLQSINLWNCIIISTTLVYVMMKTSEVSEEEIRINEKTLRKQNHELVKINRELDRFVYSVGHDLRAPITSVLGLIELSKDEKNLAQLKEYNELKEKSLTKLDGYIKDILHFSRNARLEPSHDNISFESLIKDCYQELKFSEPAEIELSITVKGKEPFYSDKMRMSAIVKNLLSNSIRYRDKRKEKNLISVAVNLSPEKVTLLYKDNGIGISQEHLPKVFDMFFRGNYQSEGTGLGLFIVKEMIEKLQGSITIDSVEGQFTSFTLTLPNLGPPKSQKKS